MLRPSCHMKQPHRYLTADGHSQPSVGHSIPRRRCNVPNRSRREQRGRQRPAEIRDWRAGRENSDLPLAFGSLRRNLVRDLLSCFYGSSLLCVSLGRSFLGRTLAACFGPTFFADVLTGPFLAALTCLGLGFFTGFLRGSTSSSTASGVAGGAGTAGGAVARGASDCVAVGAGGVFTSGSIGILPCRQGGV